MEENVSRVQFANRAESAINSLVTEDFFLNMDQNVLYSSLDDRGKDAFDFVHQFLSRLRGLSLKALSNNDLESLYEDVQAAYQLFSQPPASSEQAQDSAISMAARFGSNRSGAIAYAMAIDEGLSSTHTRAQKRLDDMLSEAQKMLNEVGQIQNAASRANNDQERTLIDLEKTRGDLQAQFTEITALLSTLQRETQGSYQNLQDSLFESARNQINDFFNRMSNESEERLRAIEGPVRAVSSKMVTDINAAEFETEATNHNLHSRYWLMVSAVLLAFLIFLGFWFNRDISIASTQEVGTAIEATAFRILIFSLGTFALIFSTRTYASHRHNFVINRQRSNALKTFELFANGSSDNEVKNAILLQAAQCVFSP